MMERWRFRLTWKLYGSIFLLFLIVSPTKGIRCFICHSNVPNCGDEFRIARSDRHNTDECPDGTCVKRRATDSHGHVRRVEVQRSCVSYRKEGCYHEVTNNLKQYTCACNTNYCNSSSLVQCSYFLPLSCFLLGFIFANLKGSS